MRGDKVVVTLQPQLHGLKGQALTGDESGNQDVGVEDRPHLRAAVLTRPLYRFVGHLHRLVATQVAVALMHLVEGVEEVLRQAAAALFKAVQLLEQVGQDGVVHLLDTFLYLFAYRHALRIVPFVERVNQAVWHNAERQGRGQLRSDRISRVKNIGKLFTSLGDVRDAILVLVSLLYFLGYIGWAVFAWGAQLGVAPPFQAQYFVAGLPVLATLGAVVAVAVMLQRLLIWRWPVWFSSRNRSVKIILVFSIAFVTIFAAILQYVVPDYTFNLTRRPLWLDLTFGAVLFFGLLLLVVSLGADGPEGIGYTIALYASVAALAIIPYIYLTLVLYPRVPQYFGGGKPRCAYLDLYKEHFSPETLGELVPDPGSSSAVVRSKEVGLIFSSGEAVYVFVPQALKDYKRFEVKRGDVSAIEWCEAFADARKP